MGQAELDSRGRPIVVVTGTGVLTSLGNGKQDNWRELTAGHSGIRRISRFPVSGLRTTIAGTIDFVPVDDISAPALSQRLAEFVIDEAVSEAGIGKPGDFPGPMFLALPPVEMEWPQRLALTAASGANETVTYDDLLRAAGTGKFTRYYERFLFGSVAENLAVRFGTKGSPVATSTACASGATAIQLGVEAIRRGEADAALVIGTDASVNPESLIRFSLLSALSTRNDPPEAAARPFSKDRDGFVMAEGAGALVLESLAHARARGAKIIGVIEGCGEMADGFHRTRSSPDGKPIIACMQHALDDAGLEPDAIGYINAHGTGTPENDKMEWVGAAAVFGDRAPSIPISSNKSMIGHTLTAAGTVEAIFTLLSLQHGRLPPTINYETPDPTLPVDCVPNVARDAQVAHALSNSFGFGGQNVSVVVGTP
ncbi:MAG TPA: beta-ketoacyl-ACP synthase [Acetobacteraceae bacterium]|jgi:3-oxoacyl-[acyl-carrier-protein] synthase II|nr:beta-ketoacyl-ACP synthase [Acetobacteraceae bacterium]